MNPITDDEFRTALEAINFIDTYESNGVYRLTLWQSFNKWQLQRLTDLLAAHGQQLTGWDLYRTEVVLLLSIQYEEVAAAVHSFCPDNRD